MQEEKVTDLVCWVALLCSCFPLSFRFLCFLSPCNEKQRTMLAFPFEFGSGFLLWFCLFFFFFALPFGPGSFLLMSSSPARSPRFSGFFLWVLLEFFLRFFIQSSSPPRPFLGFYNAREGLVSLPSETVDIVEARDHGHHRYSGCDCWIFPIKPASLRKT